MNEHCNEWECPHNKNGECCATPEEKDRCLEELLDALNALKRGGK